MLDAEPEEVPRIREFLTYIKTPEKHEKIAKVMLDMMEEKVVCSLLYLSKHSILIFRAIYFGLHSIRDLLRGSVSHHHYRLLQLFHLLAPSTLDVKEGGILFLGSGPPKLTCSNLTLEILLRSSPSWSTACMPRSPRMN